MVRVHFRLSVVHVLVLLNTAVHIYFIINLPKVVVGEGERVEKSDKNSSVNVYLLNLFQLLLSVRCVLVGQLCHQSVLFRILTRCFHGDCTSETNIVKIQISQVRI